MMKSGFHITVQPVESEVTFLLVVGVHTYKFVVGVLSVSYGVLIFSMVFYIFSRDGILAGNPSNKSITERD
jgi:hypothetical protein